MKEGISILIELINEELEEDGGRIKYHSLQDKLLKLEVEGCCRVCVLKELTLTNFIEGLFLKLLSENVSAVKLI